MLRLNELELDPPFGNGKNNRQPTGPSHLVRKTMRARLRSLIERTWKRERGVIESLLDLLAGPSALSASRTPAFVRVIGTSGWLMGWIRTDRLKLLTSDIYRFVFFFRCFFAGDLETFRL